MATWQQRRRDVMRDPEEMERDALLSQMGDNPYDRAVPANGPVDVGSRGGAEGQADPALVNPTAASGAFDPENRYPDPSPAGGTFDPNYQDNGPTEPEMPQSIDQPLSDYVANIGMEANKPGAASTTAGQAANAIAGGAFARYGTGNIPGAGGVQSGQAGRMEGFRTDAWGGGQSGYDSETIKNTAGKIFSRYEAKPSSIDAVLNDPEFRQFFPEAKKVSFDKIDFGDGKPVDVLTSADPNTDRARGWWWGTQGGASSSAAGSGGVSAGVGGATAGRGAAAGAGTISGSSGGVEGVADASTAYELLTSMVSPNASKEEMEAAITQAFGKVPGFEQAYKESVKINGVWYDLVRGYGADGAAFQGLTPKTGGGSASMSSIPVVSDQNQLVQALIAELQAAERGESSPMDSQALMAMLNGGR